MGKKINSELQRGLDKKRIFYFPKAKKMVKQELESAVDDLGEAIDRLENNKYKYATITAYYSMFHSARALVYSRGYREKSHYYLLVALKALFVDENLLDENLVNDFHSAMILREDADYHADFSKEGAQSSVAFAKQFLEKSKGLIK